METVSGQGFRLERSGKRNPRAVWPYTEVMAPFSPVSATVVAAVCTATVCLAQRRGIPQTYEEARKRYDIVIKRNAFRYHTEGRSRLARSHDARGLTQLIADYHKPHAYPEYARYTIATLLGRHFDDESAAQPLANLRKKFGKPEHSWLLARTLSSQIRRDGPAQALRLAREDKDPFRRAAAIEAFRRGNDHRGLVMIDEVCASLPKKRGARRALVCTMSRYLLANQGRLDEETTKAAARANIGLLASTMRRLMRTLLSWATISLRSSTIGWLRGIVDSAARMVLR